MPPPEQEEFEDGLVGSETDSSAESVDIDISRCNGSAKSLSGLSGFSSERAFPVAAAAKKAITKIFSGDVPVTSTSCELFVCERCSNNVEG